MSEVKFNTDFKDSMFGRPASVVFDIDGVLATGTRETVYSDEANWNFSACEPMAQGIKLLRYLKSIGLKIIIHTSRFESDRDVTEQWFKEHKVEYDELIFGKPSAEAYIDDKGIHFEELDVLSDAKRAKHIEMFIGWARENAYTASKQGR